MNKLLDAESAFCEELAVGMETYVDPLRSILSESIHMTMFLGLTEVKKLYYSNLAFNHHYNLAKSTAPMYNAVECHCARNLIPIEGSKDALRYRVSSSLLHPTGG